MDVHTFNHVFGELRSQLAKDKLDLLLLMEEEEPWNAEQATQVHEYILSHAEHIKDIHGLKLILGFLYGDDDNMDEDELESLSFFPGDIEDFIYRLLPCLTGLSDQHTILHGDLQAYAITLSPSLFADDDHGWTRWESTVEDLLYWDKRFVYYERDEVVYTHAEHLHDLIHGLRPSHISTEKLDRMLREDVMDEIDWVKPVERSMRNYWHDEGGGATFVGPLGDTYIAVCTK